MLERGFVHSVRIFSNNLNICSDKRHENTEQAVGPQSPNERDALSWNSSCILTYAGFMRMCAAGTNRGSVKVCSVWSSYLAVTQTTSPVTCLAADSYGEAKAVDFSIANHTTLGLPVQSFSLDLILWQFAHRQANSFRWWRPRTWSKCRARTSGYLHRSQR